MLPRRTLLTGGVLIRGRCRCCLGRRSTRVKVQDASTSASTSTSPASTQDKRIQEKEKKKKKKEDLYSWTIHPFLRVDQVDTLGFIFRENPEQAKSLSARLVRHATLDDIIQRRTENIIDTKFPISPQQPLNGEYPRNVRIEIFNHVNNLVLFLKDNDKEIYQWVCNLFAMRTVQDPLHRLCLDVCKVALIHLSRQGRIDLCLSILEAYWFPLTNTSDGIKNPLRMTLADSSVLVRTLIYHYINSPSTRHTHYYYDYNSPGDQEPVLGCESNEIAVQTIKLLIDRLVEVFSLDHPPLSLLPIHISALCLVGTLDQAMAKLFQLHNSGVYLPFYLFSQSILNTIDKQRHCLKKNYLARREWYITKAEPILRDLRGYFISNRATSKIYGFLIANCVYTYQDLFGIMDLIKTNKNAKFIGHQLQVPLIQAIGDIALNNNNNTTTTTKSSSSEALVQLFGLVSRFETNMEIPLSREAQIQVIVQTARLGGTRAMKKRLDKFKSQLKPFELREIFKVMPSKASIPADEEWFESKLWTGPRRSIHMNARGYARQNQLDILTRRFRPLVAEHATYPHLLRAYISCLGRFRQVKLILDEWQSPITRDILQLQQTPAKRDQVVVSFISALSGSPKEAWELALNEFDQSGRVSPQIIKSLFINQGRLSSSSSTMIKRLLTFLLVDPRVTNSWTRKDFEIAIPSSPLREAYKQLSHLMNVDDASSLETLLQQFEDQDQESKK